MIDYRRAADLTKVREIDRLSEHIRRGTHWVPPPARFDQRPPRGGEQAIRLLTIRRALKAAKP